eukprot:1126820-Amphidinium_carterae.2
MRLLIGKCIAPFYRTIHGRAPELRPKRQSLMVVQKTLAHNLDSAVIKHTVKFILIIHDITRLRGND